MIYPSPAKTVLVGQGNGWLAWVRRSSGQRVIAVELNGKTLSIEAEFADKLRALAPDHKVDAALAAFPD